LTTERTKNAKKEVIAQRRKGRQGKPFVISTPSASSG
jgi:hypothetical protein